MAAERLFLGAALGVELAPVARHMPAKNVSGPHEHYIAALDPAEVAAVRESKWQEQRAKYQTMSADLIDSFSVQEIKREQGLCYCPCPRN